MTEVLRWFVFTLGLSMAGGTLLSFSRHPHWFIRGWDFPRVHIAALAAIAGALYLLFFFSGRWYEWAWLSSVVGCSAWQSYKVFPYTPLAPRRVKSCLESADGASFRLFISNVLMQNRRFDQFLRVVREADPDVILVVEVNQEWLAQLRPLEETHPYVARRPQENMYGMALFSRLKLLDPQIRFRVQDDVPSVQADVELPCGAAFRLHGLHPRPPEPLREQDATPRDAELVLVGREIAEDDRPTVVAGDLNDVAWSATTELFLRLSGLLDPRMGRGLYPTFHAGIPLLRLPLDHVFHSNCFTLIGLRRLPHVGSDHFPVLIDLHYDPDAEQPETEEEPGDEQDAQEKLERARKSEE